MPSILFWNFNCSTPNRESVVAALAARYGPDVLVLAETTTDPDLILAQLKSQDARFTTPAELADRGDPKAKDGQSKPVRFQIFTRFSGAEFSLFREGRRSIVWKYRRPGRTEILIGFIHFYSKLSYPGQDPAEGQYQDSVIESLMIREAEDSAGHMRTVVIGDFNMDPFERGMVHPSAFGAMMCRELASRHGPPEMSSDGIRRFYNPSWSRMGRDLPEPPGTFYWDNVRDPLNTYWHCLDQVLIRPHFLECCPASRFTILTSLRADDGQSTELLRRKLKHWETRFSDHLPILFEFDFSEDRHE